MPYLEALAFILVSLGFALVAPTNEAALLRARLAKSMQRSAAARLPGFREDGRGRTR